LIEDVSVTVAFTGPLVTAGAVWKYCA